MTDYYVGSGGNNGSAGTSYATRWLTLAKALGAAGIASGDRLYITPGTYRETVTVAMTSAVATTSIIGDTDGSHTSGTPGEVVWTAYTTNDTTAASGSSPVTLAGRDFLAFSNITFVTGGALAVDATTTTSTNVTFTDCGFYGVPGNNQLLAVTVAAGVNAAWLLDRCTLAVAPRNATGGMVLCTLNRHTADYDAGIVARNSVFLGGPTSAIRVASTGAGVGFGGGVVANACTFFALAALQTADANLSTTIPCQVNNSFVWGASGLLANASGQITESYNAICASTQRTNVTTGTGSTTVSIAPRVHMGQERLYSGLTRPWFTPNDASPLLGWGVGTSPPTVDLSSRVRPSGGAMSIAAGALERHDYGTKETGTVDTGGLAVRLTGPGDHQFIIPVTSGVARTVSLKVYYDANHATTNPPQAQLVANATVGYAGQTVTAAASTGSFLTLTFTQFTPTATGYVIMRLISRSAAANGYAIFDTVTIT